MDILDEDLANVDTSMPVIRGGIIHNFEIANCERMQNRAGTGENIRITLKTTEELQTTKGDMLSAGFPIYKYLSLTERVGTPGKKDWTVDDIKKGLAQWMEATYGTKRAVAPLEEHIGQRVKCKVTVTKATDEFPNEGNALTFIKQ